MLEDLNLDGETVSKFYETLEQNGVDIDVGSEDALPPIDDVLPEVEDLADVEEVPEEEITDTDALMDSFATDDPVRMYLKEIGSARGSSRTRRCRRSSGSTAGNATASASTPSCRIWWTTARTAC